MTELKDIYSDFEKVAVEIFRKYNVTPHVTDAQYPNSLTINNNPDVVHALLRNGYNDLLISNEGNLYSHILVKGDYIVYVSKFIEAHHYFD